MFDNKVGLLVAILAIALKDGVAAGARNEKLADATMLVILAGNFHIRQFALAGRKQYLA